MTTLLEKTRQINDLLQKKDTILIGEKLQYNKMAQVLGDVLDCNTYILSEDGTLLGYIVMHDVNTERVTQMIVNEKFPDDYAGKIIKLAKTEANISVENSLTIFPEELTDDLSAGLTTIVPIYGAGERLGTIVLGRIGTEFSESDLILAEYSATVVGMQILYQKSREIEADIRSATAVQMAINTLSYSETKAVKAIFAELDGTEGRLTASNIADKIGITRSVIVNALRKLESAGVIESRSLGMKGTYIKIVNDCFIDELDRTAD